MPGGGATYIHLLDHIPNIRNQLEDEDERVGSDLIAAVCSPTSCCMTIFLFEKGISNGSHFAFLKYGVL